MKAITILLSILMLILSLKPCSDGFNTEDEHKDEIALGHNHQDDSDDSCPATCICACCGMSITYEPIAPLDFTLNTNISTFIFSNYESNYRFDFLSSIWQPPKLIS